MSPSPRTSPVSVSDANEMAPPASAAIASSTLRIAGGETQDSYIKTGQTAVLLISVG